MKLWDKITDKDVIKAIELFDRTNENYPEPRNTFLVYNDKKYPAKHIRGLAYFVANQEGISKNEYSGGQETANFFKKLGFTVLYKNETIQKQTEIDVPVQPLKAKVFNEPKVSHKLSVVSQKNALQMLLQKHFGHIETEKKFDWLKTPNHENLPKEYEGIASALLKYRNQDGFMKSNYQLSCDIVLDKQKLIFEYDENQHFTKARKISLENYLANIQFNYSKDKWLAACEKINAKDNNPIDRDEKRAYYDAVRDIEAFKHGYTLIRIKHGDVDWEAEGAEKHLFNLLPQKQSNIKNEISKHKIARLIVTGKHYDKYGSPNLIRLEKLLEEFVSLSFKKQHFEFILTPGGFLNFDFPENLQYDIDIEKAEQNQISLFESLANKTISDFFQNISKGIFQKLKDIADYFTMGIDGFNPVNSQHIELVAVYDFKKEKVIHWTGKFYPTEGQKRDLIKLNDLDTHFIKLNNQNVVILGCHDLNIYSPRGQANANPDGWKRQIANNFKNLCTQFKPDIILQHPHTTDTPNIWNLPWRTVEKELPNVRHFASGIKYYNRYGVRGELDKVLEKTKKGDVVDFYFEK